MPDTNQKICYLISICQIAVVVSLLWTLPVAQTYAQTYAQTQTRNRAHTLIDQMEALYRGETSQARITMKVITPQYQRVMNLSTISQGTDKFFIRVLSPRRDSGITTLKLGEEMWNYFPKIDKVIKVPPSMMMGSWMGSDFTNDDLVKETTLSDDYDLSLTETPEQYSITLLPHAQTITVWGKIKYIIDKNLLVPVAQHYYDDRGVLIRTLTFSDLKDYDGRLLPSHLEMNTLNKPGHSTHITYETLEFDPDNIPDNVFTLRNLQSRS